MRLAGRVRWRFRAAWQCTLALDAERVGMSVDDSRQQRDTGTNLLAALGLSGILLRAALSGCVQPAQRPGDTPAESAEAHVARARELAGTDLG
jgi:hypothetical protein